MCDVAAFCGFAGRARAKFELDPRRHIFRAFRERVIINVDDMPVDAEGYVNAGGFCVFLKYGQRLILHPGGETLAGGISPLFRLAVGGRNRWVAGSKFGNDAPNIVGKIDVLREALNDVVAFGERRAAFEDKMLTHLRLE